MTRSFDEFYEVIVKDGKQLLTYKGEVLPDQIESVIIQDAYQSAKGIAQCTITVFAKLKDTK